MPPYVAQNSNSEHGAKTTAVEAEVPKTAALDRKSGAPDLLSNASDHIANRVPGNYTSLRNNSR